MLKQYTVEICIENPATGRYHKSGNLSQVTAMNADIAVEEVRKMVEAKGHPPIRCINHAPNNTILVYCKQKETVASPGNPNEDIVWKRPAGPKRL
jgi:hypothetical protein